VNFTSVNNPRRAIRRRKLLVLDAKKWGIISESVKINCLPIHARMGCVCLY